MPHRLARATLGVVAVLALSACGEAEPPAEAAPALAESLAAVDDAIARADHDAARAALEELVADATRAGEAGRLDDDQVDAILDAAARLEEELPAVEEPAEEDSSTLPDAPPDDSGDEDEAEKEAEKARKEAEKEAEKARKEAEKHDHHEHDDDEDD